MLGRLLLLLIMIPLLELYGLIQVHHFWASLWGSHDAWMITLSTIFLTAFCGIALAKKQGFRLITEAQEQVRQGRLPGKSMLEGLLLLAGAAALIAPGYLTDFLGIFLMIPWTRSILSKRLALWLDRRMQAGQIIVHHNGHSRPQGPLIRDHRAVEIIDIEPVKKS